MEIKMSGRFAHDIGAVIEKRGYDPNYLAQKFGIMPAQAREVIREVGGDRAKLNERAAQVKRSTPDRVRSCPF